MRIQKTVATFGKYLFWTVIAAGLQLTIDNLGHLDIPIWVIPLVASILKSAATFVATKADETGYPYPKK